ncbi:hypothetical protein [Spirillospora sp. NPDC047279]|uniref:hypothetical protein n=1 Tax=Spirillospora sp. NPDC047279 TaxID=3155478 RepID=UPI0033C4BD85
MARRRIWPVVSTSAAGRTDASSSAAVSLGNPSTASQMTRALGKTIRPASSAARVPGGS